MVRPQNRRRISSDLNERVFKPRGVALGQLERISLTLDGLEAVRLADLEGLYQEGAAERMGVSRATFARILAAARRAMADALINGKALEIAGGTVVRSARRSHPCPIHGTGPRRGRGCRCRNRRRREGGANTNG